MTSKFIVLLIIVSVLFSCKKETETDPRVETTLVKSIAASICYAKATVPEKGSYKLVDYGFVYSNYNGNFGIDGGGSKISLGTTTLAADTFSTSFSFGNGYNSYETFYVRAYYTNEKGTVYGGTLSFKPLLLLINSVNPNAGKAGDRITITGQNFSNKPEDNVVKFNTTLAKVIEASSTKLVVEVPANIQHNYYDNYATIYITVGGSTMSSSSYFGLLPVVTGFSPSSGTFGTIITISGENLYHLNLKFNDIDGYANNVTINSITTSIPYNISTEKVVIKIMMNGVESIIPGNFTMIPCSITSVTPNSGVTTYGTQVNIAGIGFNPNYYSNTVKIGGVKVSNIWSGSENSITLYVPESLTEGTYDVEVHNGINNAILPKAYTVITPKITGFSPTSGSYNSNVTIFGENLSNVQYVAFGENGAEIVSRDSFKIVVKVPSYIKTGNVKIVANLGNSTYTSPDDFTILAPTITSFSPSEGTPGTIITIKGVGFITNYANSVTFGTISTTVVSNSSTEIKAIVPSGAEAGLMKILVATPFYTVTSDTDFTVKK